MGVYNFFGGEAMRETQREMEGETSFSHYHVSPWAAQKKVCIGM
jgi:hypothetical protein